MDEVSEKGFGRFYETRMNCIAKYCHGYFFPFSFVCFSFFFFLFFFSSASARECENTGYHCNRIKKKTKKEEKI